MPEQQSMTPGDYVVVASQLNRRVIDKDTGDPEYVSIRRGETLPDDVTPQELKRWRGLTRPRVIASKADLEAAAQSHADQSAVIAELQAKLAEANAELEAARRGGAEVLGGTGTDDPTRGIAAGAGVQAGEEPSGNASRDAWAAYARAKDPENAEWINDEENVSRNDLREKYKSA